jgi:glucose-1-phosphate cytidylyltransferase
MKVVILAGGLGSRLGHLSEIMPKPMVRIGDKPIIWHIMKIFSSYGLNEFVLCLGYRSKDIKEYFYNYQMHTSNFSIDLGSGDIKYFENNDEYNWNVTLVDTGLHALKGARIKRIQKYLSNDDTNILTYGDGLSDINVDKLLKFHHSHKKILTITGVRPPARFGEIIEDNRKVIHFQEKPHTSQGIINGGFMVFQKEIFNFLSEDEDCDLEVGPLEELSKIGEVMVYKHDGSWECMDNERDVLHLNKQWNSGNAFWKNWK